MPSFCCVVNCGSRKPRDEEINFFRIPAVLNFKHQLKLNELSAKRRKMWLQAISRADFPPSKQKHAAVCSRHFITGKPADLSDENHPDWVPSLFMGKKKQSAVRERAMERYARKKKRLSEKVHHDMSTPSSSSGAPESCDVGEVLENEKEKYIQTDVDLEKMTELFMSLSLYDDLKKKFYKLTLCCKSLENDDAKTRYFTGLPKYSVFKVIVEDVSPFIKIHLNTALPASEQILLTLTKLRLNLDFTDLAYRFGISKFSASTYFKNTIHILYLRYEDLVFWPERSIIFKTMPACFKDSLQNKTTIIIDCFEIKTQTPSNLLAKAQSWSNYKHSQTVKYLIGITPQGSVCFISEGWGGRVSDKLLTQNSQLLDKLIPGDMIMADRGFLIKEFVELFHASVKIPAFTRGKTQLHPIDLEETRAIAHVRIHVERVIGVIRQKFSILHETVPISLLSTSTEQPILDEIVHVCCALFNICPPIVPL